MLEPPSLEKIKQWENLKKDKKDYSKLMLIMKSHSFKMLLRNTIRTSHHKYGYGFVV
jgi:hypothetical protein